MAKKNTAASNADDSAFKKQEEEENGNWEESDSDDAPDGEFEAAPSDLDADYRDVAADRSDGWYEPVKGSWFEGRLIGRFEMSNQKNSDGKPRAYYQARVLRGSGYMKVGKGKDVKRVKYERGTLLAFDERKAMESLRPQATSDGVYNVYVEALDKEPVAGTNRTFWKFKVRAKTLRPPKAPLASNTAIDDDIPF